ncbi:MAG: nuclease-related domain-containing protein [Oscillospiraceae bacterium]
MKNYLIIGIVVLSLVLIVIISALLKKRKTVKLGADGEKKVARILKSIARFNDYKVINNIYLPLYDKTTQIDHIVIGPFGMLVIETKNHRGQIFGDPSKKDWSQIMGDATKNKLYNPLMQNQAHIDCIRHILSSNNIYKVNIESLVVFSGKKVALYVPKGLPVVTVNKLRKYLRKPKFEKFTDIDTKLIYDTLINNQVTDKKLISSHNKNVKKMAKI